MFVGLALIIVSAAHLIPAILTGEIPANWPVKPLTRESKPVQFRITFGVFTAAGAIGLGIVIWHAFQAASP